MEIADKEVSTGKLVYALAQFDVVVPRTFTESLIGNAVTARLADARQ